MVKLQNRKFIVHSTQNCSQCTPIFVMSHNKFEINLLGAEIIVTKFGQPHKISIYCLLDEWGCKKVPRKSLIWALCKLERGAYFFYPQLPCGMGHRNTGFQPCGHTCGWKPFNGFCSNYVGLLATFIPPPFRFVKFNRSYGTFALQTFFAVVGDIWLRVACFTLVIMVELNLSNNQPLILQ